MAVRAAANNNVRCNPPHQVHTYIFVQLPGIMFPPSARPSADRDPLPFGRDLTALPPLGLDTVVKTAISLRPGFLSTLNIDSKLPSAYGGGLAKQPEVEPVRIMVITCKSSHGGVHTFPDE